MKYLCAMLVISFALVLAPGCATGNLPPNLSAVGKTAVFGSQFAIAGDAAVKQLDNLVTTQVLPRALGLTIAQKLKLVADGTVAVAQALRDVDAAKSTADRTSALGKAKGAVDAVALVLADWTWITDGKIRAIVTALVASADALITNLQNLLLGLLAGGQPLPDMQHLASAYEWKWETR